MGTRATINFKDSIDDFYIYRGHDGFPDTVAEDIQKAIAEHKRRFFGRAECEMLATLMIMMNNEINVRVPYYSITGGFHGDESYKYFVLYDKTTGWTVSVE